MSLDVTRTCAGSPSRIATREGPWDSPAVSQRSMGQVFHGRSLVRRRSPGDEIRPDLRSEGDPGERADQQERAERVRRLERAAVPTYQCDQEAGQGEHQEAAVDADHQLAPAQV